MADDTTQPTPDTSSPEDAVRRDTAEWSEAPAPEAALAAEEAPSDALAPAAADTTGEGAEAPAAGPSDEDGSPSPAPAADAPPTAPESAEEAGDASSEPEAPADAPPASQPLDAAVASEAEGHADEPAPEASEAPADAKPSDEPETSASAGTSGTSGSSATFGASGTSGTAKLDAPTFDGVRGEVEDLDQHLPGDAVEALTEAGCNLFVFLAELAEVDTGSLAEESRARLGNVRDKTQLLLAAIETVLVRAG